MNTPEKQRVSNIGMKVMDGLVSLFILIFTLMPLLIVVLLAFSENWGMSLQWSFTTRWLVEVITHYTKPFIYSFIFAVITMLLTLLFGTFAAYGILTKKFRAGLLVDAIIMLPLTISHIVIGLAMIMAYKVPPLQLHGTIWIVIFSHFIIAMPIAYRTIRAMLESIDLSLVEAAESLGASEITAIYRVIMPLALPGLIACSMFSFISSMGNYSLTLMVAPERIRTLPLQLVTFITSEIGVFNNFNLAASISLFLIIIVFSMNAIIKWITGASWQEKLKM